MAFSYTVDFTNKTKTPLSVVNKDVNTVTNIGLLGRGNTQYGEVMAENLLHMLENFANDLAPSKPIEGQLWYDSENNQLKYFDDTEINGGDWRSLAVMTVQNFEPDNMGEQEGHYWLNNDNGKLYFYYDGEWVHINQDYVRRDEFNDLANQAGQDGLSQLRALGISPLTLTSTDHPFQIGPNDKRHVAYDNQQIQGRLELGTAADISINALGGNVFLGNDQSEVRVYGSFIANGIDNTQDVSLVLGDDEANLNVGTSTLEMTETTLFYNDIDLLEDFVRKDEFNFLVNEAGQLGLEQLRAVGVSPLTLTSTDHPFQVGLDSDRHVAYDNQQIQSRLSLGTAGDLSLNALGGDVDIGSDFSNVTVPGVLHVNEIFDGSTIDLKVGGSTLRMTETTLFYNDIDLLAEPDLSGIPTDIPEPVAIRYNGNLIVGQAETIDFIGPGVTVTGSGTTATVNITGGASGPAPAPAPAPTPTGPAPVSGGAWEGIGTTSFNLVGGKTVAIWVQISLSTNIRNERVSWRITFNEQQIDSGFIVGESEGSGQTAEREVGINQLKMYLMTSRAGGNTVSATAVRTNGPPITWPPPPGISQLGPFEPPFKVSVVEFN